MAWTYTTTNFDTTTTVGRLNSVRLLIGDNDSTEQQLQDEEIQFAITQSNNDVYASGIFCCRLLAAKYARLVTTQADGAASQEYSKLVDHYNVLAQSITLLSNKVSASTIGISAGGISISTMDTVNADTDRVKPAFTVTQFDDPGYTEDYPT